jgi:ADP-ribose pyrophosphatase YjhB (NUDIX family)
MHKQPFTYEQFKEIYSKVPRLCVDMIIQNEDGILLIERKSHGWEGLWHTPGGTLYYKESLLDGLKRVAEQELGVQIQPGELIGYIEYPTEEKNPRVWLFNWNIF